MKILKQHHITRNSEASNKAEFKQIIIVYKRILQYVWRYWLLLILGILGIILNSSIDAGLTWSFKPLLDQGLIARNQKFIAWLPFAVLIAFLFRGTASFIAGFCISSIGRNVVKIMRQQIFAKLLTLPASFYDRNTAGNLISNLIYNVDQVSAASASTLIILFRETFFIIGLLVVMFIISWKLTTLFFITVPFISLTATFSSKKMRKSGRKLQAGMGDITHIAEEAIEGYKVIRTFGAEKYELNKFNIAVEENRRREGHMIITNNLASPLAQLIMAIVIAITIYIVTKHMGQLSAGGFAAIIAAMLAILKPLKNIMTVNNTIQRGVVGAEGVFELLDEESEKDHGQLSLDHVKGKINFHHVDFSYENNDDKTVLKNINLQIKPGETIALVGKSGSGKSTLVSLLPRFYDNYQGQICIDDIDTRDVKLANLRSHFAYVSQHVILFNDTIGNNIAYGRFANVAESEIIAAAKAANAWEFIENTPQGLHTRIGENGLLLSGGQRQRLAIARALLKNAPILILDEATSALDTESERHIQEALARLIKNRTTLIIAHRLSTIENADRILVLKDGVIIEEGNHHQLITRNGEYAKLHSFQFKENEKQTAECVA